MKAWTIAAKDIMLRFSDPRGLLLMLVAPLAIAAIMGAAFGGAPGGQPAIGTIPVLTINEDAGPQGAALLALLAQGDVAAPLTLSPAADEAAATAQVARGEARALIVIPAGFSQALEGGAAGTATVRLLTDPASSVATPLVRAVLAGALGELSAAAVARQAVAAQRPSAAPEALDAALDAAEQGAPAISVRSADTGGGPPNPLAIYVPNMLIFFLMFAMFDNTRSILSEQQAGTLGRMLTTPTSAGQIVLGKIGGSFLIGALQVAVLIVASRLIFGLSWGSSLPGLLLIVTASIAAITALGAAVAAFSRTAAQADVVAGLITLLFAVLGGNFVPVDQMPAWLRAIGALTPNWWSLQGLYDLTARGRGLPDVLSESAALLAAALVLVVLAAWRLQRRIAR